MAKDFSYLSSWFVISINPNFIIFYAVMREQIAKQGEECFTRKFF